MIGDLRLQRQHKTNVVSYLAYERALSGRRSHGVASASGETFHHPGREYSVPLCTHPCDAPRLFTRSPCNTPQDFPAPSRGSFRDDNGERLDARV